MKKTIDFNCVEKINPPSILFDIKELKQKFNKKYFLFLKEKNNENSSIS